MSKNVEKPASKNVSAKAALRIKLLDLLHHNVISTTPNRKKQEDKVSPALQSENNKNQKDKK